MQISPSHLFTYICYQTKNWTKQIFLLQPWNSIQKQHWFSLEGITDSLNADSQIGNVVKAMQ